MAYDKFLIGFVDNNSGYQTNYKPWLIADNAFTLLKNAYVFRGRVRKRFGSALMGGGSLGSRLAVAQGTTSDANAYSGTAEGTVWAVGQAFSVGADIFTVSVTGTPGTMLVTNGQNFVTSTDMTGAASGTLTSGNGVIGWKFIIGTTTFTVAGASGALTVSAGGTGTGTFVTSTGAYTFTGATASTGIYLVTNATGTYNTSNGAIALSNVLSSTPINFYPATPVMGITQFETQPVNTFPTFAFDTQFAYAYSESSLAWVQLTGGTDTWTGSDAQFFWATNYPGATPNVNTLWVTNNNAADGIRYWLPSSSSNVFSGAWKTPPLNYSATYIGTTDGSGNATVTGLGAGFVDQVFIIGNTAFTVTTAGSTQALTVSSINGGPTAGTGTFSTGAGPNTLSISSATINAPILWSGSNTIATAQIVVPFRNRLVLLNVTENNSGGTSIYVNRCRYSAVGSALSSFAWLETLPGSGSAADAPTTEAIITAQFIKDRLIVFFEKSTWELAYTGNQLNPFVWQQLNTELGAESTFSEIAFDKIILGIGNTGIHSCNGSNVERIDTKIPQQVFTFSNTDLGVERICGIRDYYTEMVYWSFPSDNRNNDFPYPNQILTYNYVNNSWAINDDSFTAYGYYQLGPSQQGPTWGATNLTWAEMDTVWNSATSNTGFQAVMAGNQQGYTVVLNPDFSTNAPNLQITNLTYTGNQLTLTIINHNLGIDDFVMLENLNGITCSTGLTAFIGQVVIDPVSSGSPNSVRVAVLDNEGNFVSFSGNYTGGGAVARVSQIDIRTKQYNFYNNEDRNVYVQKVDFLVDRTDVGQVTVDYFVSSANLPMVGQSQTTECIVGNNILETSPYALIPLEQYQDRVWHPVYFQADGECVQFRIYMSPQQMIGYNLETDTSGNMVGNFYALEDFELHAFNIYVTRTASRMQ